MALIWVALSDDSEPIPPVLPAMAAWIWVAVLPVLVDDASAP
jgi:hypothetical protein